MTIQESNYIKLIAMITMLIDHAGAILFPEQIVFRIIGRIAFPLFSFQLSIGYEHTKNLKRYILRLLMFGICIQIIYSLAILFFNLNENLSHFNIFFTLSLGLLAIYLYNKGHKILLMLILIAPIILNYISINLDYGIYGIALILIIYIERKRPRYLFAYVALISFIYCYFLQGGNYTQMYCLIAIKFIIKPVKINLNMPRYIFYLFYPLHLAILYIIEMLIY